eukprot:TRINITY_DN10447_c0_g2_i1.p1 TRINITY_DN10447_c0_g2~~TRINITY_DN10447_c0_g2_i1.p1  ORF type:complete len:235 (-),score=5.41 TRINITY_DN10447_c0_g2_i1:245-949(-)
METSTCNNVVRAQFNPQTELRQVTVIPQETVLLFIDLQNYNCHREGSLFSNQTDSQLQQEPLQYFFNRLEDIKPNLIRLNVKCREAGIEVIYTVIQSLTRDGRDRSLDYKISGFHVPPGCWDAEVLECIKPGEDDIVLPKTSSSVFMSTNLDYILRCMEKKYVIISGVLTDQCVDHAVRDACDLGYKVTLVEDACATMGQLRHENSIRLIQGYCRQRNTEDLIHELDDSIQLKS